MKNRKLAIVAFVLCASLVIGLGYAAVTNVLDIQGSASVSASVAEEEFNEDIYFTGVVLNGEVKEDGIVAGDNQGYTANINTNNNDKGQFTVNSLANKNDSVLITYRIKNDSLHQANVDLKTKSNTNETNFGFEYYFGTAGTTTATIAAGGTVDVTVKVSLLNQLTAADSASFTIELNVTAGE